MQERGVFEEGGGAEATGGRGGRGVREERRQGVQGAVGRWRREVFYERWILLPLISVSRLVYIYIWK